MTEHALPAMSGTDHRWCRLKDTTDLVLGSWIRPNDRFADAFMRAIDSPSGADVRASSGVPSAPPAPDGLKDGAA